MKGIRKIIVINLFVCMMITYISTTNYCSSALCHNSHHIGCNNRGTFSNRCTAPRQIVLHNSLKHLILDTHNRLRSKIASGGLKPHFQSAVKMPTLQWNNELQFLAELNTKQCEMKHDQCHNTPLFTWSGQNLGVQYTTARINVEKAISTLIHSWFNEYRNSKQSDCERYPSFTRNVIGHFTAMVQEKTAFVGCGVLTSVTHMHGRSFNSLFLACDYSYTNVVNTPVYRSGRACSQCRAGCSPYYRGLCNIGEQVNPVPSLFFNKTLLALAL